MRKLIVILGALIALAGLFGPATVKTVLADAHWGYEGEDGPTHWGDLDPTYKTCAAGTEQSPIDIPASAPLNPANIVFNYQPGDLKISNNGHTIKVDYAPGSSIVSGGKTYKLLQFHFHAKSEHTIAGQYYPMELHLVHQADDGQLAVVGVLIKEGAANAAYESVLSHMSAQADNPTVISGATVDAASLLPADRSYYRYNGSLTTPPCSEGVQWHVLKTPIELSAAQIHEFTAIFSDDYRPVQPFNARAFMSTGNSPAGMPRTGANDLSVNWALAVLLLTALTFCAAGLRLSRSRAR